MFEVLQHIISSIPFAFTEMLLVAVFLLITVTDIIPALKDSKWWILLSVAGCVYGMGEELQQVFTRTSFTEVVYFHHLFHRTPFTLFVRVLILASAIFSLVYVYVSPTGTYWKQKAETYLLILAISLGGLVTISAYHLMPMILGVEIISLSSYILVAAKMDKWSAEASIKYLIYGAFTTALTLFALSLLYPVAGMHIFHGEWVTQFMMSEYPFKWAILMLFLSTLFFKVNVVPFHPWAPDVYQGSDWTIIQVLSTLPKIAVFPLLLKICQLFQGFETFIGGLAIIVIATLIVGNLGAMQQTNAKRLMAWSAIAQSGFMGMALLGGSDQAQIALLFYIVVYVFSVPAAYLVLDYFEKIVDGNQVDNFNGLGKKEPLWSAIFVISMISLIGLPPTAGLYSKLFVMSSIWNDYQLSNHPLLLAVLISAIVGTVVSLYYYLKIPYALYLKESKVSETPIILTSAYKYAFLFVTLVILIPVGIFFFPELMTNWLRVIVAFI
ncbi:MAG: NADH-quinone oxidoreductase subunit N [Cytophagaceae bacterium]